MKATSKAYISVPQLNIFCEVFPEKLLELGLGFRFFSHLYVYYNTVSRENPTKVGITLFILALPVNFHGGAVWGAVCLPCEKLTALIALVNIQIRVVEPYVTHSPVVIHHLFKCFVYFVVFHRAKS